MSTQKLPHKRIAIIGGGITGLAAAWQLRQSAPEAQVTLHEATPTLGGLIQTREINGHLVECGPDSLLRRLPYAVELCRELGIANELIGTNPEAAGVYSVHRGRLVRVPDGLASMAPKSRWQMATTPLLSLRGKLRMLRESSVAPRDPTDGDESLADFARRRFGREVFERFFQPLAGGIFMGDPERLSLPACFPQFAEMEAKHGSLIRAAKTNGKPSPQHESIFTTPQRGIGRVIETLREQLTSVEFRLGARVESIERIGENHWRLRGDNTGESPFDGVIVATPARHASTMLQSVDTTASKLLASIHSSNCAIVIVGTRRDRVAHRLDATGFVVPLVEHRKAAAGTFSSEKYSGRAPDGEVTFRVFVGGSQHPELIDAADNRLIEIALNELGELVGLEGAPLWTHVERWPQSMPQYELGHLERVAKIEETIAQHTGLELAGNAYRGVGIPYCIHSGREAARRLVIPA